MSRFVKYSLTPPRRVSLRMALTALVLASLMPMVVAGSLFLWRQWELQRGNAVERLRDRARSLQLAVDRELALHQAVLATLATSESIDRQDWRAFDAAAREAARVRPGTWIVLLDNEGRMLVNTTQPYGSPLPHMAQVQQAQPEVVWQGRSLPSFDLRVLHGPVREGRVAFSNLFYGPVVKGPVLAVAVPVQRGGRVLYSLDNGYTPDIFLSLLQQQPDAPGSWATIVDASGTVIARSLDHATWVGRKASGPFAGAGRPAGRDGVGQTVSLEGKPVIFAYARSAVADWTVVTATPTRVIFAPAWQSLAAGVAALSVVALLAGLLAWRLWRGLALPMGALADYAARRHDDAPPALPASSIDEVQRLGQALQEAGLTERAWREEVQRRLQVEARERAAAERYTAALREADQRKDEFLAMLAHELRNPLAPIRHATAALQHLPPDDDRVPGLHAIIERQTTHLARLVDDLLDVSRITRGKVALRMKVIDLATVVERAVELVRPQIQAREHVLNVVLPATPVRLYGDEVRLVQVLGNVLSNAAKYTEPGGRITLEATLLSVPEQVCIRITDNGIGIDPALLPQVFDLFRQGDRTPAREPGGLGIGLTLVQRLVELHGGEVSAYSDGPGQGARFEILLPLAPAQRPAGLGPESTQPAAPGGLTVLVVDDNADAADTLALLLRAAGHAVRTAYSGEDALRVAASTALDVVLMDIGMPGLDGYETARRMLSAPAGRPRALIAITGYGRAEDAEAALAAGFDAHLIKPVDLQRLEETLQRCTASRVS